MSDPLKPALSCFNCRNYLPDQPADWKPKWPSDYFTLWDLRQHLEAQQQMPHPTHGWPGQCRRDPLPTPVRSVHVCASHSINPELVMRWWQWVEEYEHTRKNAALRKELMAVKKLARDRLEKLRHAKTKPARAPRHHASEAVTQPSE